MANTKTTIELNGIMYDAVTGKPVSSASHRSSQKPVTPAPIKPASKTTAVNMDGFVRKKAPASRPAPTSAAKMRRPERSKTLMRHAIPKPTVAAPTKSEPKATPATKAALPTEVNQERQHRAEQVAKSPLISRYGSRRPPVEKKIAHMPVQAAPKETPVAPPILPARAPVVAAADQPAVSFTDAIANATSHEAPRHAKPGMRHRTAKKLGTTTRVVSFGAVSLAVLLLVGFIAYQNVPNFQMRLASTRAGFNASLPTTPAGFSMNGRVQASPGQISVNFRSNSDDRAFQVTQKTSEWTSESLLTNYVAANKLPYQTYEDKGRTIYIYNGSNATWVNGGVWYEIKGTSALNSDQLVQIANSL